SKSQSAGSRGVIACLQAATRSGRHLPKVRLYLSRGGGKAAQLPGPIPRLHHVGRNVQFQILTVRVDGPGLRHGATDENREPRQLSGRGRGQNLRNSVQGARARLRPALQMYSPSQNRVARRWYRRASPSKSLKSCALRDESVASRLDSASQ